MTGLLDGKEVDVKIGDVGEASVDVTKEGKVIFEIVAAYKADGLVAKTANSAEVELFVILEKVCAKNNVSWDEALIAQLKVILGLVG